MRLLTTQFGFAPEQAELVAEADEELVVLRCGEVSFVVRRGTSAASPVARHVARHGDGVGDIALVCDDPRGIAHRAHAHGAAASIERDRARIDLLCDGTIVHSVRARRVTSCIGPDRRDGTPLMRAIDHVTYCLPWGVMDRAVRAYHEIFGLDVVPNDDYAEVGDRASGMRSAVLRAPGGFTVVLTEPRSEASDGQTQRFVQAHRGPGVQHVAIEYDDLVGAAAMLRSNGVAFLPVPVEHLERSHLRLRDRRLAWDALRRHEILVDADDGGLLFQLFTRPLMDRSSFFLELIHRAGATGFGAINVPALFAAVAAANTADQVEVP